MKHTIKITAVLLAMFIATQLIGLAVVNYYQQPEQKLPYGMEPPEVTEETAWTFLTSLVVAFAIAIFLVMLLMNIHAVWLMRIWFFAVVVLAIGITLNALGTFINVPNAYILALVFALPLAYLKVFKRNMLVHNITELAIYPGIAAVFVPILNIWTAVILLVAISIWDIWAVWHSGIMQKMAKFQINKLKFFSGFFVPYADKKMREKIRALKLRYRGKEIPSSAVRKENIRVNLAILGGGDIIFPIIAAGVFLKTYHSVWATLVVTLGATIALAYLFFFSKKRKFYPAMPFITAGIFAGMILAGILLSIL